MFKKILVANRSEIAVRIIQACRELGIKTVAVYSEADAQALHVRLADEHLCIGPADAALSYRNIPNILSAAEITGAEAVHPGYGFLAENAHFAEVCQSVGIKFIGPTSENIAMMGDKAKAREIITKQGIPVLPGSQGVISEEKEALEAAKRIGYPVIIKATAGGGGRGMRVVTQEEDFLSAFQTAQAEAKTAFGDSGVYLEKYFLEPRHIEVQILADEKGRTVYLGERDCSIQRRHQKLIEESPSAAVGDALRREIGLVAVAVGRSVNYCNVGTVEFLLDKDQRFYFMEMNTRIQVEHPVTEMVTGIDLIKEQIKIAAGLPLDFRQNDIKVRGHSFECRINAECPDTFTPSPGTISNFRPPGGPGVRVDSAVMCDSVVPPYYDSLIAKLIVHAENRDGAVARMRRALDEFVIEGIKTTIPLHKRIFDDPVFQKGRISTGYLEKFLSSEQARVSG
ncbi:MAG TPA: acetyl-CoA carboxylase biotin carboxylase subunit [Nitrospiria bacterium]|nr:acetyl-CoA carboxylase biotin carboxylase subunit [Nitrospiria bacterium]